VDSLFLEGHISESLVGKWQGCFEPARRRRILIGMKELILIVGYLTAIAGLGWILHMIGAYYV